MKFSFLKLNILFFFLVYGGVTIAQKADSLDIKIGQMILIGLPQTRVDPNVLEAVKSGKIGSILLFEKNIPAKNSYLELKKVLWTYQKAATIPLFISVDQEGGKVNRLKEKYGFPRSVSAAKLGKYSLDSVRFYTQVTATTLAGLGFNVNFAPVVDLSVNPDNPAIAKPERSFSSNPDSVSMYASEVIKEHRKAGVITVLKHFPGHGSSKDDTHLGIADVTKTWSEAELIPYETLLDSGEVDAIMTAHIVNKNLDENGLPGTLSKKITTDLLRNRLNYEGVVFSDDMQMHAITKHYPLEESIRLAIDAGVDILLFSNNIQGSQERTVDKVHEIIRKLVENGTISKERIDQSFERIVNLKSRLNSSQEEYYKNELIRVKTELERQNRAPQINKKIAVDKTDQLEKQQETQSISKRKKKKKSN